MLGCSASNTPGTPPGAGVGGVGVEPTGGTGPAQHTSTGGSSSSAIGGMTAAMSTGGASVTGGANAGGAKATGGANTTGGALALGGAGVGGVNATGGAGLGGAGVGGVNATGGAGLGGAEVGGVNATGGAGLGGTGVGGAGGSGVGGVTATGGAGLGGAGVGGANATGGAGVGGTENGGTKATGGAATGGVTATGGAGIGGGATGGAKATGGANATGGASSCTPISTCTEADKTVTSGSGTHCCYTYENWVGAGSATMVLKTDGFSVNWTNNTQFVGREGVRPGSGNQVLTYSATFQPNGNSYLCVYGWTTDPLVEYYVVDGWGSWRPPGGTSLGTVTSDGGTYDIYKSTRTNQPSIQGTATFPQYWSVRQQSKTSGTITLANHITAWAGKGMNMGSFYEVSMTVEGYQSSGTADVKFSIK